MISLCKKSSGKENVVALAPYALGTKGKKKGTDKDKSAIECEIKNDSIIIV